MSPVRDWWRSLDRLAGKPLGLATLDADGVLDAEQAPPAGQGGVTQEQLDAALGSAVRSVNGSVPDGDGDVTVEVGGAGPLGFPTNPITDMSAARPDFPTVYWKGPSPGPIHMSIDGTDVWTRTTT